MARAFRTIFIMLFVVSVPSASQAQTTWHVDDDCVPPGTGTIPDPFCTIQDGIDTAQDADTVLVGPGTYTGDGNRDISLFGKAIVVKSLAGAPQTTLDIQGGPTSVHTGFFLVHNETCETVIDGFSITNGYLVGDTGGSGLNGGGGGGAVFIRDGSPTIRNCIMRDNIADLSGIPFVYDGRGGAILIEGGSMSVIENCALLNNTGNFGGGIYIFEDCSVTMSNCLVAGNYSTNRGGGIYNRTYHGSLFIEDTTVSGNTSVLSGGGLYNENSGVRLVNSIVFENSAGSLGQQIFVQAPATVSVEYSDLQGGAADIGDCCGYWILDWGDGNIDADPLFVDPENGGFHFLPGSPCIDAGNNLTAPRDRAVDLDGRGRFADDPDTPDTGNPGFDLPIVDMGAYEFGPEDCNTNGIDDADDIAAGNSTDCDENGVPDECQTDCNANDQADVCDIAEGSSLDCNCNRIPDDCEPDCNSTGQPDDCDVADGTSEDCNGNNQPDECEEDCNNTGQPDDCDVADGTSDDCNMDDVPDECQVPMPIVQQPQDQSIELGELAFFGVGVDTFLPAYQWRKDGVDLQDDGRIIGSQGSVLIILEVIPDDAGAYDCFITDLITGCENTSDSATLTVHGPCPADFDGNGAVGPFDLAILLGNWGPNPNHPADLNDDDIIDAADLALLLGHWGPCE